MGVKIPLDFTNVKDRGSVRVEPGNYLAKVKSVKKETAKSSGNPMLVVTFEFLSGPAQGRTIVDRHILTESSLWTLRNLLEAMGFKVPAREMRLDIDTLLNRKVGIVVVDGDEYQGRIKSEVSDYLPPSQVGNVVSGDLEEEDDEDDVFDEEEDYDEEEEDEDEDGDSFSLDDDDEDFDSDEDDSEEDDEEDDDAGEDDGEGDSLSFDAADVSSAKGPALKSFLAEAIDAGWEFDLPEKPKVAEVREALLALFEDEDEEEEEGELESFSIDDIAS